MGLAAAGALSGAPASGVASQLLDASVSLAGHTSVVSSPAGLLPALTGTHVTSTWSSVNARSGLHLPEPSTSLVANILPFASSVLDSPSQGVYVGEGLPPVPLKLAKKIQRSEFVEMAQMLPEFWPSLHLEDSEGSSKPSPPPTDGICDLVAMLCHVNQCAGRCLSRSRPQADGLPSHHRQGEFAGLCWVRYNADFCRQAAITGDSRWSYIISIYTRVSTQNNYLGQLVF